VYLIKHLVLLIINDAEWFVTFFVYSANVFTRRVYFVSVLVNASWFPAYRLRPSVHSPADANRCSRSSQSRGVLDVFGSPSDQRQQPTSNLPECDGDRETRMRRGSRQRDGLDAKHSCQSLTPAKILLGYCKRLSRSAGYRNPRPRLSPDDSSRLRLQPCPRVSPASLLLFLVP